MSARVYWHGVFPDFTRQGKLIKRGTQRHEIEWDDRPGVTSLVPANAIQLVSSHAHCRCGRCGGTPR